MCIRVGVVVYGYVRRTLSWHACLWRDRRFGKHMKPLRFDALGSRKLDRVDAAGAIRTAACVKSRASSASAASEAGNRAYADAASAREPRREHAGLLHQHLHQKKNNTQHNTYQTLLPHQLQHTPQLNTNNTLIHTNHTNKQYKYHILNQKTLPQNTTSTKNTQIIHTNNQNKPQTNTNKLKTKTNIPTQHKHHTKQKPHHNTLLQHNNPQLHTNTIQTHTTHTQTKQPDINHTLIITHHKTGPQGYIAARTNIHTTHNQIKHTKTHTVPGTTTQLRRFPHAQRRRSRRHTAGQYQSRSRRSAQPKNLLATSAIVLPWNRAPTRSISKN